jgi:predicted permease
MRRLYALVHHLRCLFRRSHVDDELDDELRFHIERQIEHNVSAGMSAVDARLAALRELGGLDQIKESCRDMHRIHWIESLAQDVRFGYRTFKRRPAFTLSALTIFAFGVGSSTAMFSVVNGVLLTPLPYRAPQRLIRVFGTWEHGSREGISPPDFADYRQRNTVFESVAAAGNSTPLLNLKAAGDPEQIPSRAVTSGFFATLGITPLLGREFRSDEEAWKGPRVAILSYALWQRQCGADPSIVGGALTINAVPYTVVGVLPPFFNFLGPAEVFTPMQANPVPEMRGIRTLIMVGRLKDGVDVRQARDELDRISRGPQQEQSTFDRGWSATAAPLTEEVVKDVRPALVLLMAAVGFVVLLVSAKVASLMLSHAASRRTEMSIRLALGASRGRIVRQLMTESLMLAFTGGVLGCAIGSWDVQLIKRFRPADDPTTGNGGDRPSRARLCLRSHGHDGHLVRSRAGLAGGTGEYR